MTDDEALLEWAKRTGRLVEYLPGQWVTPTQARTLFAGGPVLPADTAIDLAVQLERLARTLREAADTLTTPVVKPRQ